MNYYNEIKQELINNEVYKRVKDYSKNKSDLNTYYNVGKMLTEAGKHYGEGIIKEYSIKLTKELGKGYNISSLKRMRQFFFIIEKGATLSHQLNWSHYCELITIENINTIEYYIHLCEQRNLSIRELRKCIKSHSLSDQLSYSHYKCMLSIKNKNAISYYMYISLKNNLTVRQLTQKIKNKEYERLDEQTRKKYQTIKKQH